jgi:hypothetical protein
MAIPWTPRQKKSVADVFDRHKLDDGHCKEAAEEILPIAQTRDQRARILKITPRGRGRFVAPIEKLEKSWYDHYTTEVLLHYVDILTGPDGTRVESYREEHWQHPD